MDAATDIATIGRARRPSLLIASGIVLVAAASVLLVRRRLRPTGGRTVDDDVDAEPINADHDPYRAE